MEICTIPQILLSIHTLLNVPSLWINFCYKVPTELIIHCLIFHTIEPKRIIFSDFPFVNYPSSCVTCLHQNPCQTVKIGLRFDVGRNGCALTKVLKLWSALQYMCPYEGTGKYSFQGQSSRNTHLPTPQSQHNQELFYQLRNQPGKKLIMMRKVMGCMQGIFQRVTVWD